jgi:filamentous hemagglutinin
VGDQRTIKSSAYKTRKASKDQRFLVGGLYSNADQFRYLMHNALASQDALRLSLGVTLTSQQVGALTA